MTDTLAMREFLAIERPLYGFNREELDTVLNRAACFLEQAEEAKDPIMARILIAMSEKAILDVQTELALRN